MRQPELHPRAAVDDSPLDPGRVAEVISALAASLRSYRLYEGSNPMVDRFVGTFRQKLAAIWDELPQLVLQIEEDRILWEGHEVFPRAEPNHELAFLFYKDGIRELTLLPGFEDDAEPLNLLTVLARAPALREEEDDLITLLWQENFAHLRYATVEAAIEGFEFPPAAGEKKEIAPINPATVRADEQEGKQALTPDDFQETLYFLDEAELRKLLAEVELESRRDLWRDVLNALMDRLEDGDPRRQQRIVGIISELLPSALAGAQFDRCAAMLGDLVDLAGRGDVLAPAALREVRAVFDQLAKPETVIQLADILDESPARLSDDSVLRLLGYFPPSSIASLMQAADRLQQPAAKRAFEVCIQRLAESHREEVVKLLSSDSPLVVAGALRWIGRLQIGSAINDLTRFLTHPEPEVKVAAIEALVSIRAATAANGMVPLLNDADRGVRSAAARALGALSHTAARQAFESILDGKPIREADRVEKVAFFEAYGRLAGAEGVPVLDKILNSRGWLGKSEPSELRASAALGLARIRHPSARDALSKASSDSDPVVRSAVARALRGEAS